MGGQYYFGFFAQGMSDGGESGVNSGCIFNFSIFSYGYIEINSDKNPFTFNGKVFNGNYAHGNLIYKTSSPLSKKQ